MITDKQIKYFFIIYLIIIFQAILQIDVLAEEKSMFERELLFFQDIPVVVTAARKEQPITEAPSAITVITAQDIRESGAVSIPDILRTVPGIEVMRVTASNANVNARGFNQLMSNKMLVMVDGRSVYLDFYGIVRWDNFTFPLEEIKKIEVIRGPGSTLYGANAFSGVINIITKSPAELEGTSVSLTGGGYGTWVGSIIHAGVAEKFSYKFSLTEDRRNQWEDNDKKSGEFGKANCSLEYVIDEKSMLIFSGGFKNLDSGILSNDLIGYVDTEGPATYLSLFYKNPHFKLRYFWNYYDYDIRGHSYLPDSKMINNTHDLEFQHSFTLWERHSLIWGGDYRHKTSHWDEMLYDYQRENHWAFYLQDEYKFLTHLILLTGCRYDHHPLSGGKLSPRGSILYSPIKDNTFRFAIGTAHRNPTFLDSCGSFYLYPNPVSLPFGKSFSPPVKVLPNRDLDPEKITTYEIGYRSSFFRRIKIRADLFYNEIENLIYPEVNGPFLSPYPPHIYMQGKYFNSGDAKAWGGEFSFDFFITPWLTGMINYSYQEITDKDTDKRIRSAPDHKINGGLRFKFQNGLSANLLLHYVSETTWDIMDIIPRREKVDPYTLLNARIGRMFMNDKLEIALAIFNLLHDKHKEHPIGVEMGTRVTLNINYKF